MENNRNKGKWKKIFEVAVKIFAALTRPGVPR